MSLKPLPQGFLDELWSAEVSPQTQSFLLNSLLSFNDVTLTSHDHQAQLQNQQKVANVKLRNAKSTNSTGPVKKEEVSGLQDFIFATLPKNIGSGPAWISPQSHTTLFRLLVNNHLKHIEHLRIQPFANVKISMDLNHLPQLNNKQFSILSSFEKMSKLTSLDISIEPSQSSPKSSQQSQQEDNVHPLTRCLQAIFSNYHGGKKFTLSQLQSFKLSSSENNYYPDLTPLTSSTSFPNLTSLSLPTIDLGLNPKGLNQLVEYVQAMTKLSEFELIHQYHLTPQSKQPFLMFNNKTLDVFATSPIHQHTTSLTMSYADSVYPGSTLWALVHSPWFSKTKKLKSFKVSTNQFRDLYTKSHHSTANPLIPTPAQSMSHLRYCNGLINLTELRLVGLELAQWTIRDFTRSWYLMALTTFELTNIRKLDPTCIPMISAPESTFKNLQELIIVNCGDEMMMGIASLGNARCLPHLEKLTLTYNTIPTPPQPNQEARDEPITKCFASEKFVSLKELTFERSNLSKQVVEKIFASPILRQKLTHFGFRNGLDATNTNQTISILFNDAVSSPLESYLKNYYVDNQEWDIKDIKDKKATNNNNTNNKKNAYQGSFGSNLTSLDLTGSTNPELFYHLAQSSHLGKIQRLAIDGDEFRVKKFVKVALQAAHESNRAQNLTPPLTKLSSPYLNYKTTPNIAFNTPRVGRGGSLLGYPTIQHFDQGKGNTHNHHYNVKNHKNVMTIKQHNVEMNNFFQFPELTTNLKTIAFGFDSNDLDHNNKADLKAIQQCGRFKGYVVQSKNPNGKSFNQQHRLSSASSRSKKNPITTLFNFIFSIIFYIFIFVCFLLTTWLSLKAVRSDIKLDQGIVEGFNSTFGPGVVALFKLDQ